MKYVTLYSLFLLCIIVTKFAWAKNYTDFSHPIIVKSDDPSVFIELPANPSTGYQWVLSHYDHHLLKLVGQERQSRGSNVVGKPEVSIFEFTMKKNAFAAPQQTQINLEYLRPWESTPAKELTVKIITEKE